LARSTAQYLFLGLSRVESVGGGRGSSGNRERGSGKRRLARLPPCAGYSEDTSFFPDTRRCGAIDVPVAILLEISVVAVRFVLRARVACNHHISKPEMVENKRVLDKLGVYFAITKSARYIEIG
jgi:hypothetical protein